MSNLRPLKLLAKPDIWRMFSMRKMDKSYQELFESVFERDRHVCQFCGFQAKKHQEVINLDHNYNNNALSNVVTACCFCSQCFFLEAVGKDEEGGGLVIYLPEIGQGELNGFCHVLFCAINKETGYYEDAQAIYRNLKLRAQMVEKQLGEGLSDPSILGQVLLDYPNRKKANITEDVLAPLRLLPSLSKFSKQLNDWAKEAD